MVLALDRWDIHCQHISLRMAAETLERVFHNTSSCNSLYYHDSRSDIVPLYSGASFSMVRFVGCNLTIRILTFDWLPEVP